MIALPNKVASADPRAFTVAIVGGGPRGISVVERLVARARARDADPAVAAAGLQVHVFDPYPAGGGQVWRDDQADEFINNTSAMRNTVFTDAALNITGPVRPGPTVAEWAAQIAPAWLQHDPVLSRELAGFQPWDKPSRRLQGAYFRWAFEQSLAQAPEWFRVHTHLARVTDVSGSEDQPQLVRFATADGSTHSLHADLVISAQGFLPNLGRESDTELLARGEFPPRLAADLPLERIQPGDQVAITGLGATFFDVVGALFVGRGGQFVRAESGELTYLASGAEPVLCASSRSGLPHRSQRRGGPDQYRAPSIPLLEQEAIQRLFDAHEGAHDLAFGAEIWPQFLRQAEALFAERSRRLGLDVDFDWQEIADPTALRRFGSVAEWESFVAEYAQRELLSSSDPDDSPWTGVHQLVAQLRSFAEQGEIRGVFTAASVAADIDGYLRPVANVLASGPPAIRLEWFVALLRSGHLRLVGPGATVTRTETGFEIVSPSVAGSALSARWWLRGYQSWGDLSRTADPVIAAWLRRGEARLDRLPGVESSTANRYSLEVTPVGLHPIDSAGAVRLRRVVLGCVAGQKQAGAGMAAIPDSGGSFLIGTDRAAAHVWACAERQAAGANAGIAASNSFV